jgi:hypothetical protein
VAAKAKGNRVNEEENNTP